MPVKQGTLQNRQQGSTSILPAPTTLPQTKPPASRPLFDVVVLRLNGQHVRVRACVCVINLPSPNREQLGCGHEPLQTRHLRYCSPLPHVIACPEGSTQLCPLLGPLWASTSKS